MESTSLPNGHHTLKWRIDRLETEMDKKADGDDVERLEAAVKELSDKWGKLILALVTASVSASTAAIFLGFQIASGS